jgi:hopanoid C-2 methylase
MGPPYLAGAFAPERWDIRLYNEQHSGTDVALLAWPDLLVLTGVSTSLDRIKQPTANASKQHANPPRLPGNHSR